MELGKNPEKRGPALRDHLSAGLGMGILEHLPGSHWTACGSS